MDDKKSVFNKDTKKLMYYILHDVDGNDVMFRRDVLENAFYITTGKDPDAHSACFLKWLSQLLRDRKGEFIYDPSEKILTIYGFALRAAVSCQQRLGKDNSTMYYLDKIKESAEYKIQRTELLSISE